MRQSDGRGGERKEQVLRSWKILKAGGAFGTPFPPGTRPGGGGYLMAYASAAGPLWPYTRRNGLSVGGYVPSGLSLVVWKSWNE